MFNFVTLTSPFMSGNALPRTFLQTVGTHGIGRYVPQLQRITLKFCKTRADSKGLRDYVEHHLVDFARRNPASVVYVKPRRNRPPLLVAEYLCGNWQYVKPGFMSSEEICNWMELLQNRSGLDIMPMYKSWSTKSPSIQGLWHPLIHKTDHATSMLLTPQEIVQNLDRLAQPEPRECPITAEEQLVDIAVKQQNRLQSH